MLTAIRTWFEDFNSVQTQEDWLPFLVAYIAIFLLLTLNYMYINRSKLMEKVFYVHGFVEKKDDEYETYETRHFHNTDLTIDSFNTENIVYTEKIKWEGKHYLFIPDGKINTLTKKKNKLTVWYNGYVSKGYEYKVKYLRKDWINRRVGKKKIVNYNGMFIIGNLMIRTLNISSIEIDLSDKESVILTYIFDNGSIREMKLTPAEFFENMRKDVVPYNLAFLSQCEIIELY